MYTSGNWSSSTYFRVSRTFPFSLHFMYMENGTRRYIDFFGLLDGADCKKIKLCKATTHTFLFSYIKQYVSNAKRRFTSAEAREFRTEGALSQQGNFISCYNLNALKYLVFLKVLVTNFANCSCISAEIGNSSSLA